MVYATNGAQIGTFCNNKVVALPKFQPTKLQIGVKKRVDDCNVRSKKGDVLHMHYTVRFVLFYWVFTVFENMLLLRFMMKVKA